MDSSGKSADTTGKSAGAVDSGGKSVGAVDSGGKSAAVAEVSSEPGDVTKLKHKELKCQLSATTKTYLLRYRFACSVVVSPSIVQCISWTNSWIPSL